MTLNGGAGADIMNGGSGADHFDYLAFSESAGANIDRISGYSIADHDDLVFGALDANANASGLQPWNFVQQVGTPPSNGAGQATLTYDSGSNTTTLNLYNNDGDSTADFTVNFDGQYGAGQIQIHVLDLQGSPPIDGIIW